MRCSNCGSNLPEDSNFCAVCGKENRKEVNQINGEKLSDLVILNNAPKPSKAPLVLSIIGLVLGSYSLLVCLIALGYNKDLEDMLSQILGSMLGSANYYISMLYGALNIATAGIILNIVGFVKSKTKKGIGIIGVCICVAAFIFALALVFRKF
ncbi:MAG: zinc ribbon domain-containing protein [Acholeplasmatales bacterium]|jgi:hypothetical protein|nr:zinc ribbon domain-containing protein [Acholeplasmatales bacterium]